MRDWDISAFDSYGFDFNLNFEDPIEVSQNDRPDMVFIQLSLGEFKDVAGRSLPQSVIKATEIPR